MSQTPTISIIRFYEKHCPTPAEPTRVLDYVDYTQPGRRDKIVNSASVRSLLAVQPVVDNGNPAVKLANLRADIIRRAYEAWKQGRDMPINGTPLGAWPALTSEQVEALRSVGIRTVEEVAALNDATMAGVPVSRPRDLKMQAQRFLDAADAMKFTRQLAEKDDQIASQQEELKEQREQISKLLARVDQLADLVADKRVAADEPDGVPPSQPKRSPGRPRKDAQAEAAA